MTRHLTLTAIALACSMTAPGTPSAETYMDIHLASQHWTEGPSDIGGWNETNPGLGIDHGVSRNVSGLIGVIKNSYAVTDYYIGVDVHTYRSGPIAAGVSLLYAPGYAGTPTGTELIIPNASVQVDRFKVKLSGVPGRMIGLTISYQMR